MRTVLYYESPVLIHFFISFPFSVFIESTELSLFSLKNGCSFDCSFSSTILYVLSLFDFVCFDSLCTILYWSASLLVASENMYFFSEEENCSFLFLCFYSCSPLSFLALLFFPWHLLMSYCIEDSKSLSYLAE